MISVCVAVLATVAVGNQDESDALLSARVITKQLPETNGAAVVLGPYIPDSELLPKIREVLESMKDEFKGEKGEIPDSELRPKIREVLESMKDEFKGEKGEKGDSGEDGTHGNHGVDGKKGEKGDSGDDGTHGNHGVDGKKGEKGDSGVNGNHGTDGQNGAKGNKGDRGIDGMKGDKGDPALAPPTLLGCFADLNPPNNAFAGGVGRGRVGRDSNTVSNCVDRCAGYTYMGIQHGDYCYCGNSYKQGGVHGKKADEECDDPDHLAARQVNHGTCQVNHGCGGSGRNSIFLLH